MKRKYLLPVVIATLLLVDCKKDKKDTPDQPDNGLLAVYTMDDELKDSTGNIPKTEITKGIKPAPDRKNNPKGAMHFDAGKMWADVNDWTAESITITCWVRSAGVANGHYFVQSTGGAFGLYDLNGKMGMAISIPATNSALADFGPGWIHLACTYDGKNILTYINGQLKQTTNHPGKPGHTQQIQVGSFDGWKGGLDDLRFYKRVLTADEIMALANN